MSETYKATNEEVAIMGFFLLAWTIADDSAENPVMLEKLKAWSDKIKRARATDMLEATGRRDSFDSVRNEFWTKGIKELKFSGLAEPNRTLLDLSSSELTCIKLALTFWLTDNLQKHLALDAEAQPHAEASEIVKGLLERINN